MSSSWQEQQDGWTPPPSTLSSAQGTMGKLFSKRCPSASTPTWFNVPHLYGEAATDAVGENGRRWVSVCEKARAKYELCVCRCQCRVDSLGVTIHILFQSAG